jgi:hypothetical protein
VGIDLSQQQRQADVLHHVADLNRSGLQQELHRYAANTIFRSRRNPITFFFLGRKKKKKKKKNLIACRGLGRVVGPLLAARALPLRCAASTMLSSALLAI